METLDSEEDVVDRRSLAKIHALPAVADCLWAQAAPCLEVRFLAISGGNRHERDMRLAASGTGRVLPSPMKSEPTLKSGCEGERGRWVQAAHAYRNTSAQNASQQVVFLRSHTGLQLACKVLPP